jgi:ribosomal protein S18 acetylase RimI-like enzyme
MTPMDPDRPLAPGGVHMRCLTVADLGLLEPLWRALLDRVRDPGSVVPVVPHEASWPRRRADYHRMLSQGDSFGLVALKGDEPIGYAMVRVDDGPDPVWMTGGRYVELTSLSVMPAERDRGFGTWLLDAVEERLSDLGVEGFVIGVDAVNDGALRFYQRRGFRIGYHLLYGRVGHPAAATQPTEGESPETASHGEA